MRVKPLASAQPGHGIRRWRSRLLVMAALWLGGIRAVAQVGERLVERCSLAPFEQIGDERLLAIDQ